MNKVAKQIEVTFGFFSKAFPRFNAAYLPRMSDSNEMDKFPAVNAFCCQPSSVLSVFFFFLCYMLLCWNSLAVQQLSINQLKYFSLLFSFIEIHQQINQTQIDNSRVGFFMLFVFLFFCVNNPSEGVPKRDDREWELRRERGRKIQKYLFKLKVYKRSMTTILRLVFLLELLFSCNKFK